MGLSPNWILPIRMSTPDCPKIMSTIHYVNVNEGRSLLFYLVLLSSTALVAYIPSTLTTLFATKSDSITPNINQKYLQLQCQKPRKALNYTDGKAAWCFDAIVWHTELVQSRTQMKKERSQDKKIIQIIKEQKGAFSVG